MSLYRFEVGTNTGLSVVDVNGQLRGRSKTDIVLCLIEYKRNGSKGCDIEKIIRAIASNYDDTVEYVKLSEISSDTFNIVCISDLLHEAKRGALHYDCDEVYSVMAVTTHNNKYSALISCYVTDGDRILFRMACQETDIDRGANNFNFVFSNAYPVKEEKLPILYLESKSMMVIPYMTNVSSLVPVLIEMLDITSVEGGASKVEYILHRG